MKVNTKAESIQTIKRMGLNRVPEVLADNDSLEIVKDFFEKNEAEEYIIRDVDHAGGKYFFIKSYEEFLSVKNNYKERFSLAVSFNMYKHKLMLGDIKVSGNMVDLTARTDDASTHRNIYSQPEINIHASLDSDKLWKIPNIELILDYIQKYNLYDVVVEFTIYGENVGTNHEKVLITELRSAY